jgi:hypothetical protein
VFTCKSIWLQRLVLHLDAFVFNFLFVFNYVKNVAHRDQEKNGLACFMESHI